MPEEIPKTSEDKKLDNSNVEAMMKSVEQSLNELGKSPWAKMRI